MHKVFQIHDLCFSHRFMIFVFWCLAETFGLSVSQIVVRPRNLTDTCQVWFVWVGGFRLLDFQKFALAGLYLLLEGFLVTTSRSYIFLVVRRDVMHSVRHFLKLRFSLFVHVTLRRLPCLSFRWEDKLI